jgi:hypothetical protein
MPPERVPGPWNSFLSEIDAGMAEGLELRRLVGYADG